jgi:hypothetical protein
MSWTMSGLIDDKCDSLGSTPLSPLSVFYIFVFKLTGFFGLVYRGALLISPLENHVPHDYQLSFDENYRLGIQLLAMRNLKYQRRGHDDIPRGKAP